LVFQDERSEQKQGAGVNRILILLASLLMVGCAGKYGGDYKDGKYHRQVNYTAADANKYVGDFKNGKQDGQGTVTYANGEKYVGEWKDGKRHGQGIFALPDESQYIGEWRDDKPWEGIECPDNRFVKMYGTFSNGQWCRGCVPTEQLLATVGEVKQNLRSFLTAVNVEIALCDVNDGVLRGLSLNNPVVIGSVAMEYAYLRNRFGIYDLISQSVISKEGRFFDVLEIYTGGNLIQIYFDISSFF